MRRLLLTMLTLLLCMGVQAQENQYLRDLTEAVKRLRKANESVREKIIEDLSSEKNPKVSLMDDIEGGGAEYKLPTANRFKMNQVLVSVYRKQNHKVESNPGGLLSSKERGIFYSGIEKSVKKNGKVRYTIDGHKGEQEFVFVPYHPTAKYKVTVSDGWRHPIEKNVTDICSIKYYNVNAEETLTIVIEYFGDNSNKEPFESFAILNYNPQKR